MLIYRDDKNPGSGWIDDPIPVILDPVFSS
ncbi:hypothetical protein B0F87_10310 [Methylobacter tundripaludum]|uniref:Uncharacterized protein n=1 Tax=Methylobacter tundripaludum TaxID=173365 RepID=A0A2S6HFY8_9GAMM|nr:hypothetical protein B0F87_10310 [Methylobacter tundripaludum]